MATYREITNQVADQWVAAIKTAEETLTKAAGNAQRAADSLPRPARPTAEPFAKLNEVLAERLPAPSEIVEANFEFTNRLLVAQRDLTLRVLEAATPAQKAAESTED